jgi:hypothetical protein
MGKAGKPKREDLSSEAYWDKGVETYGLLLDELPLALPEDVEVDATTLCELALKLRAQGGDANKGPLTEAEVWAALESMRRSSAVVRDREKQSDWGRRAQEYLQRNRKLLKKREVAEGRIRYRRACMIYAGMDHHPGRAVEKVRAVLTRYWQRAAAERLTEESLQKLKDKTNGTLGEMALLEEIEGWLDLDTFAMMGQLLELDGSLGDPSRAKGRAAKKKPSSKPRKRKTN